MKLIVSGNSIKVSELFSRLAIFVVGITVLVSVFPRASEAASNVIDLSALPYARISANTSSDVAILEVHKPQPGERKIRYCVSLCSASRPDECEHKFYAYTGRRAVKKSAIPLRCKSPPCNVRTIFSHDGVQAEQFTLEGARDHCNDICVKALKATSPRAAELNVEESDLYGDFMDILIRLPKCTSGVPNKFCFGYNVEEGAHKGQFGRVCVDLQEAHTGFNLQVNILSGITFPNFFRKSKITFTGKVHCATQGSIRSNIDVYKIANFID